MKPLNAAELANYIEWINPQVTGAQLQDVYTDGEVLLLEMYGRGESPSEAQKGSTLFLLIDLRPAQPYLVFLAGKKVSLGKKNPKPVALFLASHGENLFLDEIEIFPEKGRVLGVTFRNQSRKCELEIVLIPHAVNVTVKAAGKTISWNKPKEIPEGHALMPAEGRNWSKFADEYLEWRWSKTGPGATNSREKEISNIQKSIDKKRTALEKIRAGFDPSIEERWRAFGDSLKMSNEPATEFLDLWDKKLNLRDNRERAFKKAKEQATKRAGADARISAIEAEIATLEKRLASPDERIEEKSAVGVGTQIMRKTESKGRSFNLKSGAQAIVGRSAKDNLALLRQARAWDLWIHLKDEPSAHAIIFRNKNQSISREEIADVAQWILQASSGKKLRLEGTKVDVIAVECRFVRPIKGDRLGRVTYHSPTVHSVTFRS